MEGNNSNNKRIVHTFTLNAQLCTSPNTEGINFAISLKIAIKKATRDGK